MCWGGLPAETRLTAKHALVLSSLGSGPPNCRDTHSRGCVSFLESMKVEGKLGGRGRERHGEVGHRWLGRDRSGIETLLYSETEWRPRSYPGANVLHDVGDRPAEPVMRGVEGKPNRVR